jgi:hypothetical protein
VACGNNKISRSYLSSDPTNLGATIGSLAVSRAAAAARRSALSQALGHAAVRAPDAARAQPKYVLSTGERTDRTHGREAWLRHVHVIPQPRDGGKLLVQVTDRTNKESSRDGAGHHDFVLFLRDPAPGYIDRAINEMVTAMNARPKGRRR